MAQIPYGMGVPEVAPETRAPDDYNRTKATPDDFGAAIGQAEERAGQSIEKAGNSLTQTSDNVFNIADFAGKVNSDDQVNKWNDTKNKILYGDPDAKIIGPDGQPQIDRGYFGMSGREAADARASTLDALEKARKAGLENLQSPKDQLLYSEQTRRIYSQAESQISSHADTQWKTWAGGVNATGAMQSLTGIANNAYDPVQVAHNTSDLINFRVQEAQIKFGNDPTVKKQAIDGAQREALAARLDAISVKDPAMAIRMLDKNKDIAGTQYDELSGKFRARADQQTGILEGGAALKRTYEQVPQGATVLPVYEAVGQKYGISGGFLLRTQQLETGNNPNQTSPTGAQGPFQFTKRTAGQYGLTKPFDFGASADAAARLAADNKTALTASLGRPPTDPELYLAHQQGALGQSYGARRRHRWRQGDCGERRRSERTSRSLHRHVDREIQRCSRCRIEFPEGFGLSGHRFEPGLNGGRSSPRSPVRQPDDHLPADRGGGRCERTQSRQRSGRQRLRPADHQGRLQRHDRPGRKRSCSDVGHPPTVG